ncbi:MAG: hypothetical protein JW772_05420 [Candidatus Diapherotrites archaeon]|nr:hypothetical protein [Candidatus Diapherotrites archaeon]
MGLKEIREKLKWLDPFTYVDKYLMPKINPSNNEYVSLVVYLVSAFVFAWLIYTGLGIAFGTPSPMVIVVSGSMEPVYYRGDVIILFGANTGNVNAREVELSVPTLKRVPFSEIAQPAYIQNSVARINKIRFNNGEEIPIETTGNIVVYFSDITRQPIIHRAVAKIKADDGYYVLTKGDSVNNYTIDQDCGRILPTGPEKNCISLYPISIQDLQGVSAMQIPFVGCIKLWIFDDLFSLISTGRLPPDFRGVC